MDGSVVLRLEPSSIKFDALDDRWRAQVSQFARDLEDAGCDVRRVATPPPADATTKGVGIVESLVVPLVSAGTLTTVVELFRMWLSRDSGRTLKLSIGADGATEFEYAGADLDDASIRRAFDAVIARLEEPADVE